MINASHLGHLFGFCARPIRILFFGSRGTHKLTKGFVDDAGRNSAVTQVGSGTGPAALAKSQVVARLCTDVTREETLSGQILHRRIASHLLLFSFALRHTLICYAFCSGHNRVVSCSHPLAGPYMMSLLGCATPFFSPHAMKDDAGITNGAQKVPVSSNAR